ncbi:Oidioi.mRNA.OKI2018_I69.chr1.g2845.t1.cds [Oikopleura dioica]|uniref:Oidioi.mRNA.OKI2018_I69.chr1.g2845.t1.cds n=1 Tax=Oikopleura dioica TaxID=34765 RepID=A0ABN7SXR9_OIKDI|nr:Oidioi.mRNA.OKI2018_I69.chr1.g2845.t1.cds [Oikopleura dioica]
MLCGGPSDVKPVDDEVKAILEAVKADLAAKTGVEGDFVIHGYRTQTVAGTNFFIKCSAAGKFVHARVFKPLPHTNQPATLHSVQHGQSITESSSLEYF